MLSFKFLAASPEAPLDPIATKLQLATTLFEQVFDQIRTLEHKPGEGPVSQLESLILCVLNAKESKMGQLTYLQGVLTKLKENGQRIGVESTLITLYWEAGIALKSLPNGQDKRTKKDNHFSSDAMHPFTPELKIYFKTLDLSVLTLT